MHCKQLSKLETGELEKLVENWMQTAMEMDHRSPSLPFIHQKIKEVNSILEERKRNNERRK